VQKHRFKGLNLARVDRHNLPIVPSRLSFLDTLSRLEGLSMLIGLCGVDFWDILKIVSLSRMNLDSRVHA
jgi:hypothetical protein